MFVKIRTLIVLLILVNFTLIARAIDISSDIKAPERPLFGPAGIIYPHTSVKISHRLYQSRSGKVFSYSVFEPNAPTVKVAPVFFYLMGEIPFELTSNITQLVYREFLKHLARNGYVVIYISNDNRSLGFEEYSDEIAKMIKVLLDRQAQTTLKPKYDIKGVQYAIGGHSRGGLYSAYIANKLTDNGLPAPRSLILHESNTPKNVEFNCNALEPGSTYDLCSVDFPSVFNKIDPNTTVLMMTSSEDTLSVFGDGNPNTTLALTKGDIYALGDFRCRLPVSDVNFNYLYVPRDEHGSPTVKSNHFSILAAEQSLLTEIAKFFPPFFAELISVPDATDWYAYWKPTTALLNYTFKGIQKEYVMGSGSLVRDMGKWSDGIAVRPMYTAADFPEYFASASCPVQAPEGLLGMKPGYNNNHMGKAAIGSTLNFDIAAQSTGAKNVKIISVTSVAKVPVFKSLNQIVGSPFIGIEKHCQANLELLPGQICATGFAFSPTQVGEYKADIVIKYLNGNGIEKTAKRTIVVTATAKLED